MRVLMVNKFYEPRGGTERVVFDLEAGLRDRGHEVIPFAMRGESDPPEPHGRHFARRRDYAGPAGPAARVSAAAGLIYDRDARNQLAGLLSETRPDVAHLHNIYHQLSPSILDALREHDVPTLMTLHDYKIACPTYLMFRDGRPCAKCVGKRLPWWVALHRCRDGGVLDSSLLFAESTFHRLRRSYEKGVDLFVAPSRFMAETMASHGIAPETMRVVPNAPRHRPEAAGPGRRDPTPRALFAGRLSVEKGIDVVIRAVLRTEGVTLAIAGDGPQESSLRELAVEDPRVEFLGRLGPDALSTQRARAWAVVVPSVCYENAPLSLLEAYAEGRPVLASDLGGLGELVDEGETGRLVPAGEVGAWTQALQSMVGQADRYAAMGRRALERLKRDYRYESFVDSYLALYDELIEGRLAVSR